MGYRKGRWTHAIAISLVAAASIELLQGFVIPGRRGSPSDLALNVLGAFCGFHASRALWIAAAVPLLAWLLSGPMLAPCPPETPLWWGQLSHHFGGTEPFTGRILTARFQGRAIPDDAIPETPGVIDRARREGFVLEVDLVAGAPVATRAHLAGVSDGRGNTIIAVEQSGEDLLVQWHSRAACIGFRPARALLPGVFAGTVPGDTMTVRAAVDAKAARLLARTRRGEETGTLRLLPPAGWRSLHAGPRARPRSDLAFTVLWNAAAATLGLFLFLRLRSLKRRPVSY